MSQSVSALPSTHRQRASLAAEETHPPSADSHRKGRVTSEAVEVVAAEEEEVEAEVASLEGDQTLAETDVDIHPDTRHIPTTSTYTSEFTEDSPLF